MKKYSIVLKITLLFFIFILFYILSPIIFKSVYAVCDPARMNGCGAGDCAFNQAQTSCKDGYSVCSYAPRCDTGGGGTCGGKCSGSYTEDEIWCESAGTCSPYEEIGKCPTGESKCRRRGVTKSCDGLGQQDCQSKGCTWTAGNVCATACTKTCGGGTCNNVCGQPISCNTQVCPTNTPIPTNTPAASPTSPALTSTPTAGPSPTPTPTPNPACLCKADNSCDATCVFDKYSDITYTDPIKCNLSAGLFATAPASLQTNNWCKMTLRTKGDADGNAVVDNLDYFYYVGAVNGSKIPPTVNPDFNGDGEVGISDRAIIIKSIPNQ